MHGIVHSATMCVMAATACAAVFPGHSRADVVYTAAERLAGRVAISASHLSIAGRNVDWDAVLLLSLDASGRSISAPHALRLKNGDIVPVEFLRYAAGKARVLSPLFGQRDIEQPEIAAIDFLAAGRQRGGTEPRTLYRQQGPPVPGTLLWADASRLAVETPLGIITLLREGALRYVFSAGQPPDLRPGEDEVFLIDGARLRGRVRVAGGRMVLEHSVLGEAQLPQSAVSLVRRNPPHVRHVRRVDLARRELVASPPPPAVLVEDEQAAMVLLGPCEARVAEASGLFRAAARPVNGCRGTVRLRLLAGGKTLHEQLLAPGSGSAAVSCSIPDGATLAISVDCASGIDFPCGAVITEAHFTTAGQAAGAAGSTRLTASGVTEGPTPADVNRR